MTRTVRLSERFSSSGKTLGGETQGCGRDNNFAVSQRGNKLEISLSNNFDVMDARRGGVGGGRVEKFSKENKRNENAGRKRLKNTRSLLYH